MRPEASGTGAEAAARSAMTRDTTVETVCWMGTALIYRVAASMMTAVMASGRRMAGHRRRRSQVLKYAHNQARANSQVKRTRTGSKGDIGGRDMAGDERGWAPWLLKVGGGAERVWVRGAVVADAGQRRLRWLPCPHQFGNG